jgi:hypothetical protein
VAALAATAFPIGAASTDGVHPGLTPDMVEENVAVGGDFDVAKTVHTPEIPPSVDVCLLSDETGSFSDDITNLKTAPPAIFAEVVAEAPDAQFSVAGFRDYMVSPYGDPGDWVYRLTSSMSPLEANWLAGVNALAAGGGRDIPEAQHDGIFGATTGPTAFALSSVGAQDDCGWRDDDTVTHVLVVSTDAPFHTPDATHVNELASTLAALNLEDIVLIGLTAPGSGPELGLLAGPTGGSTQPLSSDGSNIADAILAGLEDIEIEVAMESNCEAPISTSFAPDSQVATSGDDAFFTETISVAGDAGPGTYHCEDRALIDGAPVVDDAGAPIVESKWITVVAATCDSTENPHGNNEPTAPGNGNQGQNQDGFYAIGSTSGEDVSVVDDGRGTVFGPLDDASEIKYTEDDDAIPSVQEMGSNNGEGNNGNNNGMDTDYHIIGNGDAQVIYVDGFGNTTSAACLVPPPPK